MLSRIKKLLRQTLVLKYFSFAEIQNTKYVLIKQNCLTCNAKQRAFDFQMYPILHSVHAYLELFWKNWMNL